MILKLKENRFFNRSRLFIKKFSELFQKANVAVLSKAFAYYLLISFFPLLIFIGNLFSFLNFNLNSLYEYLVYVIPRPTVKFLKEITESLKYSSNTFLLIGSFLVFMWAMSRVLNILNQGINELYNTKVNQNFIIKRIVSIFYTFLLFIVVVLIAITMIFGEMIIKMIEPIFKIAKEYIDLYNTLKWPVVLIVLFAVLFFLYFFMPYRKIRIRDAMPGTIFTSAGWIILSQAFRIYLKYFGRNWDSYGTIGAVIVFLLWLNALGEIIIIGGIINGTILELKKSNT
ncbi:YihY/virulence factor BrkB family protein [Xylocopilactobacillus apis]|uniref:YihY/virulence factor BrkB family protein n=1 Tax=Xylocopilactobacillus apis TaxID=2932183 RepID=A0AAU9DN30_9LACO|nr:YihY/virulence factor BrkB family protein [Xylocopilactobacillus apis]BDR56333.1 hypothetical protein KIMC2_08950 [Xylocopilactobacillus apis]